MSESTLHDATCAGTIAIVGCGEVGLTYAAAFRRIGKRVDLFDVDTRRAVEAFGGSPEVEVHTELGSWLKAADAVLSCVLGGVSADVCEQIAPLLSANTIYVDLTTAQPSVKRAAAHHCAEAGVGFVDIAVVGAIAASGAATPLLAAGTQAETVAALFRSVGANVNVVADSGAGDAAALKLLRTVLTKGLEALAVECLTAAETLGLREQLYAVLSDLDARPFRETLDTLILTHVIHACRRQREVADAIEFLDSIAAPSQVLPAVETVFSSSCRKRAEITPPHAASVVDALAWLKII